MLIIQNINSRHQIWNEADLNNTVTENEKLRELTKRRVKPPRTENVSRVGSTSSTDSKNFSLIQNEKNNTVLGI